MLKRKITLPHTQTRTQAGKHTHTDTFSYTVHAYITVIHTHTYIYLDAKRSCWLAERREIYEWGLSGGMGDIRYKGFKSISSFLRLGTVLYKEKGENVLFFIHRTLTHTHTPAEIHTHTHKQIYTYIANCLIMNYLKRNCVQININMFIQTKKLSSTNTHIHTLTYK